MSGPRSSTPFPSYPALIRWKGGICNSLLGSRNHRSETWQSMSYLHTLPYMQDELILDKCNLRTKQGQSVSSHPETLNYLGQRLNDRLLWISLFRKSIMNIRNLSYWLWIQVGYQRMSLLLLPPSPHTLFLYIGSHLLLFRNGPLDLLPRPMMPKPLLENLALGGLALDNR